MSIDATNLFNGITVTIQEDDVTVKVSSGLRGPVGFEYIGVYSAGTTYYHTNVVKYSNALYIGKVGIPGDGITGELPTNTTYWDLLLTSTGPFDAIASQSEAETGTDNTKGMTPLRTKQAVDYYAVMLTDVASSAQAKAGTDTVTWLSPARGTDLVNARFNTVAKSADYTASLTDYTILVTTSSVAVTITLPTAASAINQMYNIKKVDATAWTVIIDGNGTETIDGALTFVLTSQYENLTIQSDGSNWHIL